MNVVVEKADPKFEPIKVVLMIESQDELSALFSLSSVNISVAKVVTERTRLFEITKRFDTDKVRSGVENLLGEIYRKLYSIFL